MPESIKNKPPFAGGEMPLAERDIKPNADEIATRKAEKEAKEIFYLGPDGMMRAGGRTLSFGDSVKVAPAIAEAMLNSPLFTADRKVIEAERNKRKAAAERETKEG